MHRAAKEAGIENSSATYGPILVRVGSGHVIPGLDDALIGCEPGDEAEIDVPPETIAKTKHGFGLPFGLWMERDSTLREMAVSSLRSFKKRGYVRPAYVDRLLQHHESSHAGYYGVMIWIVMMLEEWLAARERDAA